MISEEQISEDIQNYMDSSTEKDPVKAKKNFADKMAKIIADAIRSATVNLDTGEIT